MTVIDKNKFDTLSEAINELTRIGFVEDFRIDEAKFVGCNCKKEFSPNELVIAHTIRFEGMTDPQDDAVLFALEANDGTKGTLVMPYGAKHAQNEELITQVSRADSY